MPHWIKGKGIGKTKEKRKKNNNASSIVGGSFV